MRADNRRGSGGGSNKWLKEVGVTVGENSMHADDSYKDKVTGQTQSTNSANSYAVSPIIGGYSVVWGISIVDREVTKLMGENFNIHSPCVIQETRTHNGNSQSMQLSQPMQIVLDVTEEGGQVDKKRRREALSSSNSVVVQENKHFLMVGLGSQACQKPWSC